MSPKSIPEHLKLEIIDTKGKMSPKQLKYLIRYCPNLKAIKFKYMPDDSDLKELSKHVSQQQQINGQINGVLNRNMRADDVAMLIDEHDDLVNRNYLL